VAFGGIEFDTAAEGRDVLAHHVHADAATRYVADLLGSRESRFPYERPDFGIAHLVAYRKAALLRLGQDAVALQSGAIVAHFDQDRAALVRSRQGDRAA